MKEFTIEEKAKAYDEAIERAKKLKEDPQGVFYEYSPKEGDTVCDYIFPELKENEEEKIRKAIYKVLKYLETDCSWDSLDEEVNILDAYDWLEKQGNTIPDECVFRPVAGCDIESAAKQAIKQQGVLAKKIVLAFNGAYITVGGKAADIIVNEYNSWLEKQSNIIEFYEDKPDRCACESFDKGYKAAMEKQGEPNPYSGTSFKYNGHTWGMCARDGGVEILVDGELKAFISSEKSFIYPIHPQPNLAPKSAMEENDGNRNCGNPADVVKPKFNVGDWVVRGDTIAQILDVQEQYYIGLDIDGNDFTSSRFLSDDKIHLWSIKDAKPGDVLFDKSDGVIGIFQSIGHHPDGGSYNDPSYCFLHCRYDDGFFYADFENGNAMESDYAIPATKEQRDFLFQRMHEASYEWDAENKELHKFGLESVTFSINWKDKKAEE